MSLQRGTRTVVKFFLGLAVLGTVLTYREKRVQADDLPIYKDPTQSVEARVDDLMARLTLEEKISLLHADSKFTSAAIPRLGIPRRWMSDGPHGVREDVGPDNWEPAGHTDDFSTYLPTLIGVAATWNPEDSHAMGQVIGEEARKRGKDIMLGPGVNIQRTPLNGRTFEYMGEDPYLTGRMAVGYIHGVQANNVASCVKHFAANNQETDRLTVNVEMDERALREIYLPAFKAAVQEGGALCVMGAYNKFRGVHCCENDYLLNKILKGEWGFTGMVISDWGGTHDTDEAVRNGLDLEMGTNGVPYKDYYLADPFLEGLRSNKYPASLLDDKVRRNLRVMITTHVFDTRAPGSLNTAAHQMAARKISEDGIVLLKNEGNALPLDTKKIHTLAVIGENATRKQAHAGESSAIKAFYEITPLEGIVSRCASDVNVIFSPGYRAGAKGAEAEDLMDRAVKAAAQADVVVIVGGLNHVEGFDSEGADRKDLKLPFGQDDLIRRVMLANPHTVVVLVSGSPVEMGGWIDQVPAVVEAWYGGMEGGNALARVLFGDVNPSGKLPCTFPKRLEDTPADTGPSDYPGVNGQVKYDEGLLVGYRYYDTKNVEPLFPFGYGLSYTTFEYSNAKVTPGTDKTVATVECDVKNTGSRDGAEVVQLYVHQENPALPRPEKELKGFRKIMLKAGETKTVQIPLDRSAFAYYDPSKPGWVAEKGNYTFLIGSSSRDIRAKSNFSLDQTTVEQ
jgi:beta-glucosidase